MDYFGLTDNNNVKLVEMSTDSAPNMVKAVRLLGVDRIPCVAHIIHNYVQKVITTSKIVKDDKEVCELNVQIQKMMAIVTYFKHNTTAKCILDGVRMAEDKTILALI